MGYERAVLLGLVAAQNHDVWGSIAMGHKEVDCICKFTSLTVQNLNGVSCIFVHYSLLINCFTWIMMDDDCDGSAALAFGQDRPFVSKFGLGN